MLKDRTVLKRAYLQGTTPFVEFTILDPETRAGFKPSTLTLSIYDYDTSVDPHVENIINDRNDEDVLSFCDADGHFLMYLRADDTELTVPEIEHAIQPQRRLLFTWTWGEESPPEKVGKHEIIFPIQPDRETVAT